jgi:BirA family transcriptional regulator, biotin operon repressor / biotin---[acetyl-CoA-carboxylase] ligase
MRAESLPPDIAAMVAARADALGPFARHSQYYRCITSTNDVAARLADAGAAEGTWVVADEQTAGRGRRGRTWASPPGAGLYLSVIFRPLSNGVRDDGTTSLLTLMAGVAAAQGVRAATGLAPGLKWPNDLVIEPPGERSGFSRFRKLAGILAEGSASGGELQSVVIGIGINLTSAAYPPDVEARATSIEGELGRPVDRAAVLVEVLAALAGWRRALIDGRRRELLETWRTLGPSSRGRRIRWMRTPDRAIVGITQGIDDTGALLVKTDAGVERIIAGDVHWEE